MTTFKELYATFDPDAGIRGKQFERFVKWFLKNDHEWSTQVEKIWLWDEYPDRWGKDCGIDLVFKHKSGEFWAVQAKCYAPTTSITKADMDTFLSESSRHGIDKRLLIATTDLISANAKQVCDAPQAKKVTRFMLSHFESSTLEYPARLENINKVKKKEPPKPRAHQIEAIAKVAKQFKTADRGQLIMACGTGKTYTTLWVKEKLAAQNTLVLLPSLGLLSQTLREWTASATKPFEVLCVCSDQSVGKKEVDESIESVSDLGFPVTSEVKVIQKFINGTGTRVIFSTYQSSPLIAEAQKNKKLPAFDLVIADEAHRCAGKVGTDFSTVLNNKLIRADKRLFATATPRLYSTAIKTAAEGRGVEMVGMDDEALFGKVLYSLPFGKAIAGNLLTDYQVVIIGVDNPMILKWIKDRELLELDPVTPMDAQALASLIGLLKAIDKHDLKRVISFHSRVNRAESFVNDIQKVVSWIPKKDRPSGKLITDFVSGTMPTDKRRQKLDRIRNLDTGERGILSNARCLSEGVDVPSLDGVAFIDPRASQVDIIQAVGRAIRLSTNKKIGTIVLPVFIEDGANAQASIEASNFKPIWDVLNALRAHDDVLSQELDQARTALGKQTLKKNKPSGLSKIVVDLPASIDASFSDSLKTYLVEQVTESWHFWYGLLEVFVKSNRHSNVNANFITNEKYKLGAWVSKQRQKKEIMPLLNRKKLELIDGWSWDARTDKWDKYFCHLKEYIQKHKHANIPNKYITNDGLKLGSWVTVQRSNKKNISAKRICLLEKLKGWSWDVLSDQWEAGYNYLINFVKLNKHSLVPDSYKLPNKSNLGGWVSTQRMRKDKLSKSRQRRLEAIKGWSWDPRYDSWDSSYDSLVKFAKTNKHTRVPQSIITKDGVNLKGWIASQRSKKEKLSKNRIKLLESIVGWSWDALTDKWEESYNYLCAFVKLNGHARVTDGYKTKDGFTLGNWVRQQRLFKDKMSIDRKTKLELLYKWSWDIGSDLWEEGFENLKIFFKQKGHVMVPNKYKMSNGYNLGGWVSRQRAKKEKLSPSNKKRLEKITGWKW